MLQFTQNSTSMVPKQFAGLRQDHFPPQPIEQSGPEFIFERADLDG